MDRRHRNPRSCVTDGVSLLSSASAFLSNLLNADVGERCSVTEAQDLPWVANSRPQLDEWVSAPTGEAESSTMLTVTTFYPSFSQYTKHVLRRPQQDNRTPNDTSSSVKKAEAAHVVTLGDGIDSVGDDKFCHDSKPHQSVDDCLEDPNLYTSVMDPRTRPQGQTPVTTIVEKENIPCTPKVLRRKRTRGEGHEPVAALHQWNERRSPQSKKRFTTDVML